MEGCSKEWIILKNTCWFAQIIDFVPSFASSAHSTLNYVNQDSSDLDSESEPDLNASTVENTLTSTELDHVKHTSVPVDDSSVSLEVNHISVDLNHDVQSIPILVEGDHAEHHPVSENDEGLDFSNTTSKSYWWDQKKIQRRCKKLTSPVKTAVFFKSYSKGSSWCFTSHNMWKCVWSTSLPSLYREVKNTEQRKEVSHIPSAPPWHIWGTITKSNFSGLVG